MALIEHTLFGKVDKVKVAVERIKTFDPSQSEALVHLAPYYVAYSGGKDSDVLRILFELSGVKYDLVHNHTTVDAPETVYYIRSIPNIQISMPEISMWDLIVKQRMPPTRTRKYCCKYLKERGGVNRFVATGVRWGESPRRKATRGLAEIYVPKKGEGLILNADNHESRKMIESCITKGKRFLNPIVDWSTADVWEFLDVYGCKSNPLYEIKGRAGRVGCIGCPENSNRVAELELYPKYKNLYIKAFDRMIEQCRTDGVGHEKDGIRAGYRTGEECFDWWVSDKAQAVDENQMEMEF